MSSATTGPAIVADTTSYLPPELTERHGVQLDSLYVGIEGQQERESEITDYDDFYERLRASGEAVTTSQPSVGDFISSNEPLLADGREIVSVHISAGISGTLEAAKQAIERLTSDGKGGERIHTVDSRSAAGGTGMVLLAAMIAASGGADPGGRPPGRAGTRRRGHLVLARHARVPAPGRTDRRGAGGDRIRHEDQADPH